MASGVDPREFAERLAAASAGERLQLSRRYVAWLKAGAAKGQWWVAPGLTLIGLAAMAAFFWIPEMQAPAIFYLVALLAAAIGVGLCLVGARKEKVWRSENPFGY